MFARNRFVVGLPDPETARTLAAQAAEKAARCEFQNAIRLIEEAMLLDSTGTLSDFISERARFYKAIGEEAPTRAIDEFTYGCRLQRAGRFRDAELAHERATALDPCFLWPLNNLAWMLATSEKPTVRDGKRAVKYARRVCEQSNWNCWSFIGTLAAAFAEASDFHRAIGWQKASLKLVPENDRRDAEIILRHFERHRAYIDEGLPSVGGDETLEDTSILKPEQITSQSLAEVFARKGAEPRMDADGDLMVTLDGMRMKVSLSGDRRSVFLRVMSGTSRLASVKACMRFVNRFNMRARVAKALVLDDQSLVFEYEIMATTPITRASILASAEWFRYAVAAGVNEYDHDGIFSTVDDTFTSTGVDDSSGSPALPSAAMVVESDQAAGAPCNAAESLGNNGKPVSPVSFEPGQTCRLVNAGSEHEDFRFRLLPGTNATIQVNRIAEQGEVAT